MANSRKVKHREAVDWFSRIVSVVAATISIIAIVLLIVSASIDSGRAAVVQETAWQTRVAGIATMPVGVGQFSDNSASITPDNRGINFSVDFTAPGQSLTIYFNTVNSGTVPVAIANLDSFNTARAQLKNQHIDLTWQFVDAARPNVAPQLGDELNPGANTTIKAVLKYDPPAGDNSPVAASSSFAIEGRVAR
ncbi:MAG: hypothetical protein LBM73_02795 [Candidatus Nomurabacteria bacterium]|jgi:hypothetical protein|nr:hypothetical protein [Candidatus Nomurabacteria bacterium]